MLTITQIMTVRGPRYYMKWDEGNLNIINRKALEWHLKRMFNVKSRTEISHILSALDNHGQVQLQRTEVAA